MINPDLSGTDPGKDNATVLGIISAEHVSNWNISSHSKRARSSKSTKKGHCAYNTTIAT